MASRAPPWPAAARSTERSMLISLTAARSRCRTPRRFSNEVLRAPGASASSLLASGSPQLAKAEGGDPSTPAEAASDRSVIRATSSRNSERNHPGTPSEIKSDWRATPFRIRERLRPESAQHRPRVGILPQMRLRTVADVGPHLRAQNPLLPLPRLRRLAPSRRAGVRQPADPSRPARPDRMAGSYSPD